MKNAVTKKDGNRITIGRWLYDEKPEPELSKRDAWRRKKPSRPLGRSGDPVVVERSLLKSGHTILRGKTGAGKSSQGILPLMLGLMEPYELEWKTAAGKKSATRHDAIVVIDLGGDKAMFHAARKRAQELGRAFRFLSLDPRRSMRFDPFQSIAGEGHRIIRLCNLLLEAFSLDHGIVYGGSWFSQRNLLMLLEICEEMVANKKRGGEVTLKEVDRYLRGPKCAQIKDAEQIRGIFRFLLEYEQLQPEPGDQDTILLERAIQDGEVIYAYLPAISEATTARQIAGLLLQTTVASAMKIYEEREGDPSPQPHVHVFVDELATIAGASFESLLTGSRKYSMSLYMAFQTTESMRRDQNNDLSPAVRDNSILKLLYTVTGERDIEELQSFSRETTRPLRSSPVDSSVRLSGRGAFGRDSESESICRQLTRAEILDISATKGCCLAIVEDGLGHREPIPMVGAYAISEVEYLEAMSTPLPLTTRSRPKVEATDAERRRGLPWELAHWESKKRIVHRERLQRIAALVDRLESHELLVYPGR